MDKIKVSILIPAFNVEKYIDDCLHSLVCQTLKEIEVIVINDGSTDATGEIAERYAASDPRFRVIDQSNQGIAQSRNISLSLAQGKYVGFVDSDDYVSTDAFERLFLRAETYSADIVLGSISYSNDDGTSHRVGDKSVVFQSDFGTMEGKQCFKALMETGCYTPMVCGNLYRSAFIRQNHLHFEATFHEDEYFTPYALFYANKVIDFKDDFYFYRQHPDSIMHVGNNLKKRSESLCFISLGLKKFVKEKITRKECSEIELTFLQQADFLCEHAQYLYEKELYSSSKKCLFIFSEASTAAQYGVGTYVRQLAQCFDLSEWDVNVIVLHSPCKEVQWDIKDGVACYEIPIPDEMQYSGSALDEKAYCKGVFYYLVTRLTFPKDIYCHFNFVSHYDLALLFKEKLQARVVFTLHYTDWSFDLLGDKEWLKRILANPTGKKEKRVTEKFEQEKKFMTECCDYVIAIARHSYIMLKDLYDIPEYKLAYIPNGLKDEYKKRSVEECQDIRKKYGFEKGEMLLIFAGRLDLVKGIVELIEAFKQVQVEIPSVKLIIAGTGNFTRCLEAASPDWSHIVFTGFIPKEQLYDLYAIADVGIVPSIHEEFGYVAAEMMMNELPIVVNNTTGLKELVKDGEYGTIFDFRKDRDFRALKDAIISILHKRSEDACLHNGRNRILNNYSIQSFFEKIMSVYTCVENPCSKLNNSKFISV